LSCMAAAIACALVLDKLAKCTFFDQLAKCAFSCSKYKLIS
jgi:hypothetical protein